jgi:hypothetical protein
MGIEPMSPASRQFSSASMQLAGSEGYHLFTLWFEPLKQPGVTITASDRVESGGMLSRSK